MPRLKQRQEAAAVPGGAVQRLPQPSVRSRGLLPLFRKALLRLLRAAACWGVPAASGQGGASDLRPCRPAADAAAAGPVMGCWPTCKVLAPRRDPQICADAWMAMACRGGGCMHAHARRRHGPASTLRQCSGPAQHYNTYTGLQSRIAEQKYLEVSINASSFLAFATPHPSPGARWPPAWTGELPIHCQSHCYILSH